MKLEETLQELIKKNRAYFLSCVSECSPHDLEDLQECINEIPKYRQDFSDTLYVAKKTKMCLHLFDLVESIDGDLGDDFKVTPGAKKILLKLIKEHGRIKVMRKIINGIRRAEEEIIGECRDICRTPRITEEKAKKELEKLGSLPCVTFSEPNRAGQRMFMGMILSPTGKTISF